MARLVLININPIVNGHDSQRETNNFMGVKMAIILSGDQKQKDDAILQDFQEKQGQFRDGLLQQLKGTLDALQYDKVEEAFQEPPPPPMPMRRVRGWFATGGRTLCRIDFQSPPNSGILAAMIESVPSRPLRGLFNITNFFLNLSG